MDTRKAEAAVNVTQALLRLHQDFTAAGKLVAVEHGCDREGKVYTWGDPKDEARWAILPSATLPRLLNKFARVTEVNDG